MATNGKKLYALFEIIYQIYIILGINATSTSRSEFLAELMLMRAGGSVAINPSTGATVLAAGGR